MSQVEGKRCWEKRKGREREKNQEERGREKEKEVDRERKRGQRDRARERGGRWSEKPRRAPPQDRTESSFCFDIIVLTSPSLRSIFPCGYLPPSSFPKVPPVGPWAGLCMSRTAIYVHEMYG